GSGTASSWSKKVPGASGGSSGASAPVERNRSARGPSRMLARLLRRAIRQDLLGQISVVACRAALRIVLEHAGALHRGLGELDRLADPALENEVAEVLLEDL